MKPLRIFNPNLELLAEIDDYDSLIVTRKWHTFGDISLAIHRDKKHADKLVNGNILLPGADFENAGVIRRREGNLDTLTIQAPFLGSYLAQRVIVPQPAFTGPAESVMKHLVDTQAVNPVNPFPDEELNYFLLPFMPASFIWRKPFREFRNMVIAEDGGKGITITREGKYQQLSAELESISKQSGLGWGVRLDNRQLTFEVYEGNNHTITGDNPVIFSPEFDNVQDQHFTDSLIEYKNAVYVANETEVAEVGEATGAERFEHFVKAPDGVDLQEHGSLVLLDTLPVFTLEAEALGTSFVYKKDWDLGDMVTIRNRSWGIQGDTRITQVQEVYEPNNIQVYITFGESAPTIIDKVKHEIKRTTGGI